MKNYTLIMIILLGLSSGCAGTGGNQIVAPDIDSAPQGYTNNNRYLWGLWDVFVSEDRSEISVFPIRSAQMHLNAVRLLEEIPCNDCLVLSNIKISAQNEITADLTLKHPFPDQAWATAFDVRAIFLSQGDYVFPENGLNVALGDTSAKLLDSDGYTTLFNPYLFPVTDPPSLGYIKGKYSTFGILNSTLNPFIAFRKNAPRRMFETGCIETRTLRIYAPTGTLHFGYAIDISWQTAENVVDPLLDMPPDANCLEAYQISVEDELTSEIGYDIPIKVIVYDHQGKNTIESVRIEAPDICNGEIELGFVTTVSDEGHLFSGIIINDLNPDIGDYNLLVRVIDTDKDENLGDIDAFQLAQVSLVPEHGWYRVWDIWDPQRYPGDESLIIDETGNQYIFNGFSKRNSDFDPGPGEEIRSPMEYNPPLPLANPDAFILKLDPKGEFEWVKTWGGKGGDIAASAAIDSSGTIFVRGGSSRLADIDPGDGVFMVGSENGGAAYISKFDLDGNFLGALVLNNYAAILSLSINTSGDIAICGSFTKTVDFDPGPGTDWHSTTNPDEVYDKDAFVSMFDTDFNYYWTQTWGRWEPSPGGGWHSDDIAYEVTLDDEGNVYVTGGDIWAHYKLPSVYFLKKFNKLGSLMWDNAQYSDQGSAVGAGVCVDSSGNCFVVGKYNGSVNFDRHGDDILPYPNKYNGFLLKYDVDGEYKWGKALAVTPNLISNYNESSLTSDLLIDNDDIIYVTGMFTGVTDLDPGPGVDIRYPPNSNANDHSAFLIKLDNDGNYIWGRDWAHLIHHRIVKQPFGPIFLSGDAREDVDFDPGPGISPYVCSVTSLYLIKLLPNGYFE